MKQQHEDFAEMITTSPLYQPLSEAIDSVIDVLVADNERINTAYVDHLLYEENLKRGIASSEALRIRRSKAIIAEHIRALVFASAEEQIERHGIFRIPGCGDNDYVFDDDIIEKYEVFDESYLKDDMDKYGYIDIEMTGALLNAFERYDCSRLSIAIYFYGELGLDFIKFTEISDVTDYFMRVEIRNDDSVSADNLVALADELLSAKKNILLIHEMKYAEKRRV